jgi:molybdopterin-guanine dinucleotide biosynthesis protein B
MKLFGLAGWSGSGKTTLVARLLPALIAHGVSVSTVKHAHESFDIDKPGKDSHTHRMAGAREVMVSSVNRWALIHEHRGAGEPGLDELVRLMAPVDLLLVEGFKRHDHDKLEIHRAANGKPFLHPEDPRIVAIASDVPVPGAGRPVLDLDDVPGIADFVLRHCGLAPP